jgi:hypothetical protein
MRYLLLIYGPQWDSGGQSPEEMQAVMEESEGGEALEPVTTATTVRVRDGERITTDGPFAETNEVLGGYYVLNCKDLDEAIEIAAQCPGARGGSIELRPITEFGEEYRQAVMERAGLARS